jgi:putative peptide zinc metalloprotease protein
MSIDRPTFSESWYRVAELNPRLHGAVRVQRQEFRGTIWFVLQDPGNCRFFRVNEPAYHFIAMLDGRRTVSQVWQICLERFSDAAPTQGEVIQLLCRLHASNLLLGNIAQDAEALFERHRKQVWRDVHSAFGNLFFIRLPLWDPDPFLNRWAAAVGHVFSTAGFLLWAAILAAGLFAVAGNVGTLASRAPEVLNPGNLPLLYAAIVVVKLLHEFGHAFACKHFGRRGGSGGEVHQMGLTFLFFTPLPYVDASSSWALGNKWHRIVVGAGGILAELAIASIAAILWTQTADGSTINVIAYNIMLIAGVSSLAFNGNPFLRYDAYYILLDFLEIPNLESRSKLYVNYLAKRYIWGLDNAADPSHNPGERGWLLFYAIASTVCRIFILAAIALMLMNMFVTVGSVLVAVLFVRWAVLPLGRLIRFLATSGELARHRPRAMATTALTAGLILIAAGLVRMPDRCRIEGIVEPLDYAVIHMKTTGYVHTVLDSGTRIEPDGPALVTAQSPELELTRDQLQAEKRRLRLNRNSAQTREFAAAQIVDEQITALEEKILRTDQRLKDLSLRSPIRGVWVAPDADRLVARRLEQGERIGVVADLDRLRIRAVASQQVASRLIDDARPGVTIKVKNRPGIELDGRIEKIIPAGQEQLPSAALGYEAGGAMRTDVKDSTGRRAAVPFFEILVVPSDPSVALRPGQTMVLRFETSPKPLAVQAWRTLLQLFQQRIQA